MKEEEDKKDKVKPVFDAPDPILKKIVGYRRRSTPKTTNRKDSKIT